MAKTGTRGAFEEIAGRLSRAASVLCVTHARPDGDGLGSMAALATAAAKGKKRAFTLVPDRLPRQYEFLFPAGGPAGTADFERLSAQADLILVLDTSADQQLDAIAQPLARVRDKVAVIDHHATAGDLGSAQWIDTTAAATGVMVAELLPAAGLPVDLEVAGQLTVAVTTDTGWLRFANTDGRALRLVAQWLDMGVRTDVLYRRLFQVDRPERVALLARALASLEIHCGGLLAIMTLRRDDFQRTGAVPEETENLVNEALRIGSVDTAILLAEQLQGPLRASLRSREMIDVARIAQLFGGGGHARAAGVRRAADIDAFKADLIGACSRALGGAGAPQGR